MIFGASPNELWALKDSNILIYFVHGLYPNSSKNSMLQGRISTGYRVALILSLEIFLFLKLQIFTYNFPCVNKKDKQTSHVKKINKICVFLKNRTLHINIIENMGFNQTISVTCHF